MIAKIKRILGFGDFGAVPAIINSFLSPLQAPAKAGVFLRGAKEKEQTPRCLLFLIYWAGQMSISTTSQGLQMRGMIGCGLLAPRETTSRPS